MVKPLYFYKHNGLIMTKNYQLISSTRNIDFAGYAVALHTRRDIYRITPNIIGKLFNAAHPGLHLIFAFK